MYVSHSYIPLFLVQYSSYLLYTLNVQLFKIIQKYLYTYMKALYEYIADFLHRVLYLTHFSFLSESGLHPFTTNIP